MPFNPDSGLVYSEVVYRVTPNQSNWIYKARGSSKEIEEYRSPGPGCSSLLDMALRKACVSVSYMDADTFDGDDGVVEGEAAGDSDDGEGAFGVVGSGFLAASALNPGGGVDDEAPSATVVVVDVLVGCVLSGRYKNNMAIAGASSARRCDAMRENGKIPPAGNDGRLSTNTYSTTPRECREGGT